MSEYLLEVGCEEIPADFIQPAASYLTAELAKLLDSYKVSHDAIECGGTPRRIWVVVKGLAEKQDDLTEEVVGPPANVAFDDQGNLTKAGLGFAKSKGLGVETLEKKTTERGEYLVGTRHTKGGLTRDLVAAHIAGIVRNIPFRKSMRWGAGDFKFARPVHWFCSVFDGELLPFEIDGLAAGTTTRGHRFIAPDEFAIKDFASYKSGLAKASVAIDDESRKAEMRKQIEAIAKKENFVVDIDEGLLATVSGLVEYPVAILGTFNEEYLTLPKEVLVTSMKIHQKYFYVEDKDGNVLNHFIGVSNIMPTDVSVVAKGYERVLKARLADAMFFFENDKNVPLDDRAEELKKVVYQEKLGTSHQKVERFTQLAAYFADAFAPAKKVDTLRAAAICKADLMTEMVYEFPELQGVMGQKYALIQGEKETVANAIVEHYLPKFAGDVLPASEEGAFISMADKLDTIAGCFSVDLIPTGNNDPYALRRSAIGIIQTVRDKGYRFALSDALDVAMDALAEHVTFDHGAVKKLVREFIMGRFRQILAAEGITVGAFDAVSNTFDDIISIVSAAKALSDVRESEDFQVIAGSYKRINNILKKSEWSKAACDPALFTLDAEKNLFSLMSSEKQSIESLIEAEKFDEAMKRLLEFRKPVDQFFDDVLVNAEDEKVRANRLGLLCSLRDLFMRMGDIAAVL